MGSERGNSPEPDHVFVLTRRGLRRILVGAGVIVVLAALVAGAYLIGRSTKAAKASQRTTTTTSRHPASTIYDVTTGSMEPAVDPGDHVRVVPESSSRPYKIQRGEIIVFRAPSAERGMCAGSPVSQLVRRVIGLPGERISSHGNTVLINGSPLAEPWLPANEPLGKPIKTTTVPADSYYVLGDNRPDSCDSRYWGTVPQSLVLGKVVSVIPTHDSSANGTSPDAASTTTTGAHATSSTTAPPTTTTTAPLPSVETDGCDNSGMEPAVIDIACATGELALQNITWTSWGPGSASGTGTYADDSCTPYCYDGSWSYFPAQFTLSNPGQTSLGYDFQSVSGTYDDDGTTVPFSDSL